MKIQLLLAIGDHDYAEHLSRVLAEKHADIFEISVSSTPKQLEPLLAKRHFDVALLDVEMAGTANMSAIRLPLLVWDGAEELGETAKGLSYLQKYQRISAIVSSVIQQYAAVSDSKESFQTGRAHITAVWSPAGGIGKTTVALACAAKKANAGKDTIYLDLQPFSTTQVYFKETGTSISSVFENLGGDVSLLFRSIRQKDTESGIYYFGAPQNYDDINILTVADIASLLDGCAANADALVVDLGSNCTEQVRQVLEKADQVLLVADSSPACQAKCQQFRTQHNVYGMLADKLTVVANRGSRNVAVQGEQVLNLPRVDSNDPVLVYKTLSNYMK